eukprot:CAMPEP_0119488238 /NCGR_PEP_ID=MMETSP1344-20130328/14077_1 /TAXON_ID=236787 /ORGANISM="Florenciella parvula, Strain CCMP2471" /LENGTH=174 /DNA_ID=CAMNT_0007523173 /DNA_START=24 /DNA_END=544 /DNA_ORIENTATION=+
MAPVRAATALALVAVLPPSAVAFQSTPLRHSSALHTRSRTVSPLSMVIDERKSTTEANKAKSIGPAVLIRKVKESVDIPWLAEGDAAASNKVNVPDHIKAILSQPNAPKREKETPERVARVRGRADEAAEDAKKAQGMTDADKDAWFRSAPPSPRAITKDDPLRVIVAGGGLAG